MSVFWSKQVPKDAIFACYPFGKYEKVIFSKQITKLPDATIIKTRTKRFQPTQQEWLENISKTLTHKNLSKVVLARYCEIECESVPNPFAVASSLLSVAKNSIVFCFADEKQAFVGATPELLFSRLGREITCEAVAGTTSLDKTLGEKERREILPVIDYIQQKLSPFCTSTIHVSPIGVRQTSYVQHYYATLKGTLNPNITDEEIIRELHPTPALCGVPKKEAMEWIEKCEPFERGLYGGILGWSTPEEAEYRKCLSLAFQIRAIDSEKRRENME